MGIVRHLLKHNYLRRVLPKCMKRSLADWDLWHMLTLIKLGGSLITDKHVEKSFRRDVVKRLADEIAAARAENPNLKLLIGHGSGSFGHFAAKRANTIAGVYSLSDWRAFAEVSNVAAEL